MTSLCQNFRVVSSCQTLIDFVLVIWPYVRIQTPDVRKHLRMIKLHLKLFVKPISKPSLTIISIVISNRCPLAAVAALVVWRHRRQQRRRGKGDAPVAAAPGKRDDPGWASGQGSVDPSPATSELLKSMIGLHGGLSCTAIKQTNIFALAL